MYDLAVLAGSSVGKKCVFLHAWDFFTMCKIFLSFVWWVWTSLKILYAKVPAGLALCQYKELIAVEILYIYCECCMWTDRSVEEDLHLFHSTVLFLSVWEINWKIKKILWCFLKVSKCIPQCMCLCKIWHRIYFPYKIQDFYLHEYLQYVSL